MEEVKAKRDYKAEYKKFQSSTKAKKYRAELNKYNRQKGTYGNGDGKDASHKGGKIVGFEAQSKNRGRAEKSRLKKESNVVEGKLETLALNLLRDMNKNLGIQKYDHKKGTTHFKKVLRFLQKKMPRTPMRKLGDIAMSYDKYRQKQPKATIPDIDSVKDMEKTLKSLGMKESVNEGVNILNELRIDLPNFDKEKHKRDIFGLFNKLKIKGMLGDRQGKTNWLVLKDKDDWKKAEPILKKLKIKYKLKESAVGEHHQAITRFILTALSKAGIKIKKVQMMKKSWLQGKYWYGGFFTVRAQNNNDVLPFYVDKKGNVNLQVSPKDYIIGKYPNMSTLVQNLKDFKKTDLDESVNESAWTPEQTKAVEKLDRKFYKLLAKKGIKPYSPEAARIWTTGGFRDEMKKIFGKNESVNEFKNMSPGLKKALAQKGYGPLFFTIDQSKRQLKQMKYTKGEIEDTLFTMFGDQDPKIVKKIKESKIKESINEKKGAWFNSLFPKSKVQKAIEIAKEMGGNMTGATKKIEKFFPGMILNTDVQDALRKYNESINEQEMSIKDAFKDLVKDHGAKKALDMLADVLTGGALASMDDKKVKAFKKKLLKKVTTESANKVIEGLGDRISKISKKYSKGQKKSKKALKNKKGPYQEEMNENSKVYSVDVDDMVDILSSWDKYADGNIFMGKNLHGKKPEPFATKYGQQSGGKEDALKALVKRWKKLDVKPQTTIKIFNAYHKLPDSKKMFSNPDFWEDFLEKNGITVVSESINETPYELGGMKVYSKADGLKKVKSMQKTDGAKIYKVTKTKTKLYDKYPVTMYNLHTKNKNHSTNSNPYGLDMMKGAYLIPIEEGTCGYGLDGNLGEEPAGPHLIKKKKKKGVTEKLDKTQASELLKQLGGNKFIMMTGAKNFTFGSNGLAFKIGRNAKAVNYVVIDLNGKDLYDMKFQKGTRVLNKVNDVYNDQLQKMFTKYTGMYTSLGTMGR